MLHDDAAVTVLPKIELHPDKAPKQTLTCTRRRSSRVSSGSSDAGDVAAGVGAAAGITGVVAGVPRAAGAAADRCGRLGPGPKSRAACEPVKIRVLKDFRPSPRQCWQCSWTGAVTLQGGHKRMLGDPPEGWRLGRLGAAPFARGAGLLVGGAASAAAVAAPPLPAAAGGGRGGSTGPA
jgi:hypothetical protein